MEMDTTIKEFCAWCCNHDIKAVRSMFTYLLTSCMVQVMTSSIDWYKNKVCHHWYLPSLNGHLSPIRVDHWALVPRKMNNGESMHAHTNFYTGMGLSLLAAINV
jgi:hypothetical protein